MTAEEPKVEITLKEVYDTVMATHNAVTGFAPRLKAVEETAKDALTLAQGAATMAKENRRYLVWIGRALAVIIPGGIVAYIGAWASHHMK